MRMIERTSQFKRDYKRERKSDPQLDKYFIPVVTHLASDVMLAPRLKDHSLTGNWNDHRECHIKPNLLLIYRKPDEYTLHLVRLGSHSELF
ncbi:type II toxin-antitoxin system RelE/ParE family toxin [Zymomonas mobilis]|uniref:Addiction module toxin, RelE/StbE family n=1 Tax=Zymomonas mobilis subsp. mobilis (strain ATCC 10988 / DSM 424 / LMG 404 / NCIMB 8938 / NRRL B-806 / ZM1) TaxID=555217 RepID=A0A0H3G3Z9_ZYMMA|nr:type II toxin-antitoxin system YafQ family toxin [Zymomonas mobilis]AEH63564.1 addiction module toxin, RelE/StbE family [Zymomonas mobilis subsp. mobilis ATCC 10988]TQL26718.1 mRNA interferase YafQ [Zymomonas mobilis]